MKIRTSGSPHPQGPQQQQRSLSPPPNLLSSVPQQTPSPLLYHKPAFSPTEAIMTGPLLPSEHHQAAPHVMVSRINARLSSIASGADSKDTIFDTGSPFAEDESTTDHSWSMSTNESFGDGSCVQTSTSSSVSSSLSSNNGRWCEEERAIPLKKRRVVMASHKTSQSKEMNGEEKKKKKNKQQDAAEIWKPEIGDMEDYKRCNRRNGKRWRCNRMRVEGYSLCKHHLERQKMRKINSPNSRNQIKKNKEVKARSITSLLRDTVPLLR